MEQERDAEARALRAAGMSYREIGGALGVATTTAWAMVNRERHRATNRESMRAAAQRRYGIDMEWTERRRAANREYYARRRRAR